MEWLEQRDDETKAIRAWLHDYITRLEGEVDPGSISLKLPVKIRSQPEKASGYSLVLEDGDGVIHYWLPDGRYDGYARRCRVEDGAGSQPAEDAPAEVRCERCGWAGADADLVGDAYNCPECGSTWEVTER